MECTPFLVPQSVANRLLKSPLLRFPTTPKGLFYKSRWEMAQDSILEVLRGKKQQEFCKEVEPGPAPYWGGENRAGSTTLLALGPSSHPQSICRWAYQMRNYIRWETACLQGQEAPSLPLLQVQRQVQTLPMGPVSSCLFTWKTRGTHLVKCPSSPKTL